MKADDSYPFGNPQDSQLFQLSCLIPCVKLQTASLATLFMEGTGTLFKNPLY